MCESNPSTPGWTQCLALQTSKCLVQWDYLWNAAMQCNCGDCRGHSCHSDHSNRGRRQLHHCEGWECPSGTPSKNLNLNIHKCEFLSIKKSNLRSWLAKTNAVSSWISLREMFWCCPGGCEEQLQSLWAQLYWHEYRPFQGPRRPVLPVPWVLWKKLERVGTANGSFTLIPLVVLGGG